MRNDPFRFAVLPEWLHAESSELAGLATAWRGAEGVASSECDEALREFARVATDPEFRRLQDGLAKHMRRIAELVAAAEVDDTSTLRLELSSLSGLRLMKFEKAFATLERVARELPATALKDEVEAALGIARAPAWIESRQRLADLLGGIRRSLSPTGDYRRAETELREGLTAIEELHEHVFDDRIDHGALADHPWLDALKRENRALFDRIVEATDEDHIHIRRGGLNDPDHAVELLARRRGTSERAATPMAASLAEAADFAPPEFDPAKLARGCDETAPSLVRGDLKKLGVIAALVGTVAAAAAIFNRRSRDDREATPTPPKSWQTRLSASVPTSPSL